MMADRSPSMRPSLVRAKKFTSIRNMMAAQTVPAHEEFEDEFSVQNTVVDDEEKSEGEKDTTSSVVSKSYSIDTDKSNPGKTYSDPLTVSRHLISTARSLVPHVLPAHEELDDELSIMEEMTTGDKSSQTPTTLSKANMRFGGLRTFSKMKNVMAGVLTTHKDEDSESNDLKQSAETQDETGNTDEEEEDDDQDHSDDNEEEDDPSVAPNRPWVGQTTMNSRTMRRERKADDGTSSHNRTSIGRRSNSPRREMSPGSRQSKGLSRRGKFPEGSVRRQRVSVSPTREDSRVDLAPPDSTSERSEATDLESDSQAKRESFLQGGMLNFDDSDEEGEDCGRPAVPVRAASSDHIDNFQKRPAPVRRNRSSELMRDQSRRQRRAGERSVRGQRSVEGSIRGQRSIEGSIRGQRSIEGSIRGQRTVEGSVRGQRSVRRGHLKEGSTRRHRSCSEDKMIEPKNNGSENEQANEANGTRRRPSGDTTSGRKGEGNMDNRRPPGNTGQRRRPSGDTCRNDGRQQKKQEPAQRRGPSGDTKRSSAGFEDGQGQQQKGDGNIYRRRPSGSTSRVERRGSGDAARNDRRLSGDARPAEDSQQQTMVESANQRHRSSGSAGHNRRSSVGNTGAHKSDDLTCRRGANGENRNRRPSAGYAGQQGSEDNVIKRGSKREGESRRESSRRSENGHSHSPKRDSPKQRQSRLRRGRSADTPPPFEVNNKDNRRGRSVPPVSGGLDSPRQSQRYRSQSRARRSSVGRDDPVTPNNGRKSSYRRDDTMAQQARKTPMGRKRSTGRNEGVHEQSSPRSPKPGERRSARGERNELLAAVPTNRRSSIGVEKSVHRREHNLSSAGGPTNRRSSIGVDKDVLRRSKSVGPRGDTAEHAESGRRNDAGQREYHDNRMAMQNHRRSKSVGPNGDIFTNKNAWGKAHEEHDDHNNFDNEWVSCNNQKDADRDGFGALDNEQDDYCDGFDPFSGAMDALHQVPVKAQPAPMESPFQNEFKVFQARDDFALASPVPALETSFMSNFDPF